MSAIPACATISGASGYCSCEPREVVGDRRQPTAAVDQDRDAPLSRQREYRDEPLVVHGEPLGPRVELDAARAEVEAARRLLDRALGQVEAHERDEAPFRALRECERPVVRGAECGVAVGLVEAEHEAPLDPVALVQAGELLEGADHPVDVVPEVDVRVEDRLIRGQDRRQRRVPASDELLCLGERLLHGASLVARR